MIMTYEFKARCYFIGRHSWYTTKNVLQKTYDLRFRNYYLFNTTKETSTLRSEFHSSKSGSLTKMRVHLSVTFNIDYSCFYVYASDPQNTWAKVMIGFYKALLFVSWSWHTWTDVSRHNRQRGHTRTHTHTHIHWHGTHINTHARTRAH